MKCWQLKVKTKKAKIFAFLNSIYFNFEQFGNKVLQQRTNEKQNIIVGKCKMIKNNVKKKMK